MLGLGEHQHINQRQLWNSKENISCASTFEALRNN